MTDDQRDPRFKLPKDLDDIGEAMPPAGTGLAGLRRLIGLLPNPTGPKFPRSEAPPDDEAGAPETQLGTGGQFGSIPGAQLADGSVPGSAIEPGSLDPATFASSIKPVLIVATLPALPHADYPVATIVFNQGDAKLYKNVANAWVSVVNTGDITGTISSTQIADNAVTTPKLDALAITSDKLAANSVIAGKVAAAAISTTELAAGAVTADKLGANSVTAVKIAAGIISTDKLVVGGIDAGTVLANLSITNGKLGLDSVTADKIQANSVTSDEIAANTITAGDIAAGTITANEIATGTITGPKLQDGTVTGVKIQASTITADRLSTGTINSMSLEVDNVSGRAIVVKNGGVTIGLTTSIGLDFDRGDFDEVRIGSSILVGTGFGIHVNGGVEADGHGDFRDQGVSTRVVAGAHSNVPPNNEGQLGVDSTNGRFYFRYGSTWHYVAQTAGFEIPEWERLCPACAKELALDDAVVGRITDLKADGGRHALYVHLACASRPLRPELVASHLAGAAPVATEPGPDRREQRDAAREAIRAEGRKRRERAANAILELADEEREAAIERQVEADQRERDHDRDRIAAAARSKTSIAALAAKALRHALRVDRDKRGL